MTVDLRAAWEQLPEGAPEAIVSAFFSPQLLNFLGFEDGDIVPNLSVGDGNIVDQAARKKVGEDVFLFTQQHPFLLVELKGRPINLTKGSASYASTVKQIYRYLMAPKSRSAQWGLITNSQHIQLFRKHGKVNHHATDLLSLDADNVVQVATMLREKMENPPRALTVTLYNNKGGVGKTTTTVNLSGILTAFSKKVLTIDLDPHQQDLTSSLGLSCSTGHVYESLKNREGNILETIQTVRFQPKSNARELTFDVIPADLELAEKSDQDIMSVITSRTLHTKLEQARQVYDYIFIDAPPNWRLFSQLAVYAADVVLIPTKHNNLFSLENAATVMKQFIPETQAKKQDGGPIPLPIFFNGEKITDAQENAAQREILSILKTAKSENFDLLPYFFPRYIRSRKNCEIFSLPSYANIASSAFSRIPAVYRDKTAHEYYKDLAKEYFLQ